MCLWIAISVLIKSTFRNYNFAKEDFQKAWRLRFVLKTLTFLRFVRVRTMDCTSYICGKNCLERVQQTKITFSPMYAMFFAIRTRHYYWNEDPVINGTGKMFVQTVNNGIAVVHGLHENVFTKDVE